MPVRAVTERVAAHRRGLQFYSDGEFFDRFTDELATGEDIYSSETEVPSGRGLQRHRHLFPNVGAQTLRAGEPSGHTSS